MPDNNESQNQDQSSPSQGQSSPSQDQSSPSQDQSSTSQGQSSPNQGQSSTSQGQSSPSQGQSSTSQDQSSTSQGQSSQSPSQSPSQGQNTLYQVKDVSGNIYNYTLDASGNMVIVNQTIVDPSGNFTVENKQFLDPQGDVNTTSTFTTNNDSLDVNITQDLKQDVEIYDQIDPATLVLVNTIKDYAQQIKCEKFHGKGSIDDYKELFQAAQNIANESHQMTLNVDVEGFSEFGQAADQLASLFTSFISRLENVNIINDSAFLQSIASALQKIVNLSNVFGKFKDTIIATSTVRLPKSVVDTSSVINNVMNEVNCAMNYMTYFVNPVDKNLTKAVLSDEEKSVITNAVSTINNWNTLCTNGVSITMANDANIKTISSVNSTLKSNASIMQSIKSTLQSKLASFNKF